MKAIGWLLNTILSHFPYNQIIYISYTLLEIYCLVQSLKATLSIGPL